MLPGRTEKHTGPATISPSSAPDTTAPGNAICPPSATPSRKFVRPMNPATNRVAGRVYNDTGSSTCSIRPAFITTIRSDVTIASL